ncbi:exonuclease domain-containing protein [Streptomyces sp. NPDC029004]|uniref:exonuclease domain-containing protein n=1 Tax=Streptomyces sp. NPDC029004 TaxID=3154490 RepID=UPI0033C284E7
MAAAVVEVRAGEPVRQRSWLADPGIRIPAQASAIHGISSEHATAGGHPARDVADEVAQMLTGYWTQGVPVVALTARLDRCPIGPVIDPYTIDRAVDRYRKGKRNLEAVCAEYGVRLDVAHDATADALAAVRVACAIATRHEAVAALTPAELHERQIQWYAEWAEDFQRFLRGKGERDAVVDGAWPLREPASVVG